ncbi:hypothetical protein [Vibrio sp. D431a]|uniref:condensin complex protein MksE n=1 Tax=Vibrio sp. D431a TaxID=2837388 RepID=UPI00255456CA|nr:hypothetical protein [Vibrio sp. D431a]MDK9789997.1 hypothetical protein [Vibrio sp. D431a]
MITARVTESLLSQKFICPHSDREGYVALNDEKNRIKIASTLSDLNRVLKQTSRGGAYYAAYKSVNGSNKATLRRTLQDCHELIRPVVGFIALVSEAQQADSVLGSGAILTQEKVITQINSSQSLQGRLDKVCRLPKVKQRKHLETTQEKVEQVFEFLKRNSLVALSNKERGEFTVTGKMDFMYELIEYIDNRENIVEQMAEQKDAQQELGV